MRRILNLKLQKKFVRSLTYRHFPEPCFVEGTLRPRLSFNRPNNCFILAP